MFFKLLKLSSKYAEPSVTSLTMSTRMINYSSVFLGGFSEVGKTFKGIENFSLKLFL